MTARPRVLWLSGECPEPPHSGIDVYSCGLLHALAGAGAAITVLAASPGAVAPEPADGVDWVLVDAASRSRAGSLLSPLPAMAYRFAGREMRAALTRVLAEPWDAIVVDHLQTGWAARTIARARPNSVLVHVSHNAEREVRATAARAERRPGRRVVRWVDARKTAALERAVVAAADVVTAITDVDARSLGGDGDVIVLTPGYGDGPRALRVTSDRPRRAVLLGNFEWRVKDENLVRFLRAADAEFAAAGAELRVVGPVGPRSRALGRSLRATSFAGWVPELDDELAAARVGIVAERVGGGFKLKTLDLVFHGVPIAALEGSVAGLPLLRDVSILEFPHERALARGVLAVLDDADRLDAMRQAALKACRGRFRWDDRGTQLRHAIDAAITAEAVG